MTNPLLQSQLDRFDQLVAAAKKYVHIDSAAKDGKENTSEYAVRALGGFAIKTKEHIASCDKERLMWVVEQLDKLEWHSEFENPEFRKASELGWARFKLDFSSLIKKEIGVTE